MGNFEDSVLQELWIKAFLAYASLENAMNPESGVRWANVAVDGFVEKFAAGNNVRKP